MTKTTSAKVASIAAQGLSDPESLTPDEIQSLSASALAQTDPDAVRAEKIAELRRIADRRRGQPGYEQNVRDIEAEIARLEAGA